MRQCVQALSSGLVQGKPSVNATADLVNGDDHKGIEGILIGEDEDGLSFRASGKLAIDPLPPMGHAMSSRTGSSFALSQTSSHP